jgi:hypothetical protein
MIKVLLLGILFSTLAHAGTEKGNGGDAVVCRDSKGNVTSAELFDYYEGKTLYQVKPDLGSSQDYRSMVIHALKRLERVDHMLSRKYVNRTFTIEDEMAKLPGIKLEDIKDTGEIYIPNGCAIEQVAIRRKAEIVKPGEKRFIVSLDIWEKMPALDKAGLILHEIIYEQFSPDYGIPWPDFPVTVQDNSIKVRNFNYSISTAAFEQWSAMDYVNFIRQLGVQLNYVAEYHFPPKKMDFELANPLNFHTNNIIASGILRSEFTPAAEWEFRVLPKAKISLFDTGKIQEVRGFYTALIITNQAKWPLCGSRVIPTLFNDKGGSTQAVVCKDNLKLADVYTGKLVAQTAHYLYGAIHFGANMRATSFGVLTTSGFKIENESGKLVSVSCQESEKVNGYCAYQLFLNGQDRVNRVEKRIYVPEIP